MQYTHEQGGYTITPATKKQDEAALKKFINIMYGDNTHTNNGSSGDIEALTALKKENPARYDMFMEWSREVEEHANILKEQGKVCRVTADNFEQLRKDAEAFKPFRG